MRQCTQEEQGQAVLGAQLYQLNPENRLDDKQPSHLCRSTFSAIENPAQLVLNEHSNCIVFQIHFSHSLPFITGCYQ
jgi:hypothetical protein